MTFKAFWALSFRFSLPLRCFLLVFVPCLTFNRFQLQPLSFLAWQCFPRILFKQICIFFTHFLWNLDILRIKGIRWASNYEAFLLHYGGKQRASRENVPRSPNVKKCITWWRLWCYINIQKGCQNEICKNPKSRPPQCQNLIISLKQSRDFIQFFIML